MDSYRFDPKRPAVPGETHILLAEDGQIYARIVQAVLNKAGYTLSWVDDGVKAYEAIRDGFRPSLLITDVLMPGMSGFELITRLKSENCLPPTIVLTGLQKEEEVLRGLQCGAEDYIKKPFSAIVLLARVELVLGRHATQAKNG